MKTTNRYNLPKGLYDALTSDSYDLRERPRNILSVTEIVSAPLEKELVYRHWENLVEDATDCTWKVFGGACHGFVEKIGGYKNPEANRLTEERWFLNLETLQIFTVNKRAKFWETKDYDPDAWYVSGMADCYDGDEECVDDYKVTSVYAVKDGLKTDWERQVNIYCCAYRLIGFPVKAGRIVAILRDWSKGKSLTAGYPETNIKVLNVPMWPQDMVVKYIRERAKSHILIRGLADDDIPLCTPEERWSRPGKIAVMKKGRKSAIKLFPDDLYGKEDAERLVESSGSGHYIDHRPGVDVKCESYCSVKQFCRHGKKLIKREGSNE